MKISIHTAWTCLSLAFAFLPAGLCSDGQDGHLRVNEKRQLQEFAIDETRPVNPYCCFLKFDLPTFADTDATVKVFQIEPDIPAEVNLRCSMHCASSSGTIHLLLKEGDVFQNIEDQSKNSTAYYPGDTYISLEFKTTQPGPVFVMGYVTDGALVEGDISCTSEDVADSADLETVYINSDYASNRFDLLSYGEANSIRGTTTMVALYPGYYYSAPITAETDITCVVTCDSGGQGVIEFKEAERFAQKGEGTAISNLDTDSACPFSVTFKTPTGYDPLSDEPLGWLLLYSLNSNLVNARINCTAPVPDPTPYPTYDFFTTIPSQVPSQVPSQIPSQAPVPPIAAPDEPPDNTGPSDDPPQESNCWCDWFGLFCPE